MFAQGVGLRDRRGRSIVFVSHCLMNQNARFPGIAVAPGSISGLTRRLEDAGFGIEQLPCLEMRYWGGANRRLVMPFLRLSSRLPDGLSLRLFMRALSAALAAYRALCRLEARRVAAYIGRFLEQGYRVPAIIFMNDSPTCGLDRTIDLAEFVTGARGGVIDWSGPSLDTMSRVLPGFLREGSGAFAAALRRRIDKSGLPVGLYGFDPWADPDAETDRLSRALLPG